MRYPFTSLFTIFLGYSTPGHELVHPLKKVNLEENKIGRSLQSCLFLPTPLCRTVRHHFELIGWIKRQKGAQSYVYGGFLDVEIFLVQNRTRNLNSLALYLFLQSSRSRHGSDIIWTHNSHTHTLTLSHSLTHSRTHSLSLSQALSLSHTHAQT